MAVMGNAMRSGRCQSQARCSALQQLARARCQGMVRLSTSACASHSPASRYVQSAATSVQPYRFRMTASVGKISRMRRSKDTARGSPLETAVLRHSRIPAGCNPASVCHQTCMMLAAIPPNMDATLLDMGIGRTMYSHHMVNMCFCCQTSSQITQHDADAWCRAVTVQQDLMASNHCVAMEALSNVLGLSNRR